MFIKLIIKYFDSGVEEKCYHFVNKYDMYAYIGYLYMNNIHIERIVYVILTERPQLCYLLYYSSQNQFLETLFV